jgi:hypothetical protein
MNWSQQRVYLKGMNDSKSTDNVRGISSLNEITESDNKKQKQEQTMGNINTSFLGGMNGTILLSQPDYKNQQNILHNNITERVLNEQIFDNKIFIDSYYRDHLKHKDPFKFTIKFNGIEPKKQPVTITLEDEQFQYHKYSEGDTDIVIDRVFRNIKSVSVDALIMPYYLSYKTAEDGSYEPSGPKLAKSKYKYLVLKINELRNGRCYSNNPALGKESFIMVMDDDICIHNQLWVPIHKSVAYFDSQLKVVDRLNVEICDDKGEKIYPMLDGKRHDFYADYAKTIDVAINLQNNNTEGSKELLNKLMPKLKSLKNITESLSPELHLTFNTIEPQINTLPQYRY